MDIRKLQRAIVDGLEDVKAQDILVFNTEHLSPLFERVIIASGTSNRQTKALAASVRDAVKGTGERVLATEGEDNGEWIIVDCGAAVAHIMQPAIREYYRLEEIWGGKPVKLKLGANARSGLVKAEEPEYVPEPPKAAAGAKTGRKAAAKKSVGRKAMAAGESMSADRLAAAKKSTAARKAAPRKKVAEPRGPVSQTVVVKSAPRKTGAKAAATSAVKAAPKPVSRGAAAKPATRAPAKPAPRKTAAAKAAPRKSTAAKSAPRKTASRH